MSSKDEAPSLMSVLGLASTLSLTVSVLIFVFTAWGWETVTWAATRYAIFSVTPIVIIVALWGRTPANIVAALVTTLAFGAPLYIWTLPDVRADVVRTAGGYLPGITLISALDDTETVVADEACVSLMSRGYNAIRFQLPEIMRRPKVMAECLSREIEGTDAPDLIRRDVALQWEAKILGSNTPNACELIPGYLQVAQKSPDIGTRLFHFSTAATHEAVRECALEQFTSLYPSPLKQLQALGNPTQVDATISSSLFRSMTILTYGHTEGLHQKVLATPLMKQWGLSLGCHIVADTALAIEVAPMLNTAASLQGCGQVEGVEAISVWTNACSDALAGNTGGLVTTSMVCEKIHTHAMDTAQGNASTVVHAAIERLTQQELDRQIAIGERDRRLSARLDAFAGYSSNDDALDDLPPTMAADMRRSLSSARRGGGALYPDFNGAMKGGINRGMAELFIQMGETGMINGIDIRGQIASSGADPDDVFSQERMAEVRRTLGTKQLDQSGINDEGADAGMYDPDVSGPTMEEFLGRERESEE